jgi:hypothetical protein
MQAILAEQPLVMAALLAAVAAVAIWGWLQTGARGALAVGVIALLLIPLLGWLSLRWVTDREQIKALIQATAEALEANDVATAVAAIDPARQDLIAAAKADLGRFRFSKAKVNRYQSIEVIEGTVPPEAEVDMAVGAELSSAVGAFTDIRVVRRVVLRLRKSEQGRWFVYDYNHLPFLGDSDPMSPNPNFIPQLP